MLESNQLPLSFAFAHQRATNAPIDHCLSFQAVTHPKLMREFVAKAGLEPA